MRSALDRNDVFFASARAHSPIIAAMPAPRGKAHVTRFFHADDQISDLFHVKPVYYETREGFWRPLSEITVHHGNRRIVLKPEAMSRCSLPFLKWLMVRQSLIPGGLLEFGYPDTMYWGAQPRDFYAAASLTVYPDPDPETTTVDGYIQSSGTSWSVARDAAIGGFANSSGTELSFRAARLSSSNYVVERAFLLFDASAIGDSDTITAATIDIYVLTAEHDSADAQARINVVSSSPATNTNLITSDFNDIGATEYGDNSAISALTTGAYNTLTLTATGRDAISKTGISKFALRVGNDFTNTAPGVTVSDRVTTSSADESGTSQDPKLTVTYTVAVASDALGAIFF